MAEQLSDAVLVAIADSSHMMLGHDEEVRAEVAAFLEACTAEGAEGASNPWRNLPVSTDRSSGDQSVNDPSSVPGA
jgi:hypothetical protein